MCVALRPEGDLADFRILTHWRCDAHFVPCGTLGSRVDPGELEKPAVNSYGADKLHIDS